MAAPKEKSVGSSKPAKFHGLDPALGRTTTLHGKPRYVFYIHDRAGTYMGQLEANNTSATASAALKSYFKYHWKNVKPLNFYIGDRKQNGKRITAKWDGRTTATGFGIFTFTDAVKSKFVAKKKGVVPSKTKKSTSGSKSKSTTASKSKSSRSNTSKSAKSKSKSKKSKSAQSPKKTGASKPKKMY